MKIIFNYGKSVLVELLLSFSYSYKILRYSLMFILCTALLTFNIATCTGVHNGSGEGASAPGDRVQETEIIWAEKRNILNY
jgi:hypothetical protein